MAISYEERRGRGVGAAAIVSSAHAYFSNLTPREAILFKRRVRVVNERMCIRVSVIPRSRTVVECEDVCERKAVTGLPRMSEVFRDLFTGVLET